ncbi:MAG TPA: zinc-binding dehydrogenase [Steroidobacteraceae bacterium]|nr:zinc-binding dehydrogenase [Steroidobacteraceae bacterium]
MRVLNVHGVNDVRMDPIEAPRPGADDAVVRIKACGVCGTDLTFIRIGGMPQPGGQPMPLGHEASGEVIAVGGSVKSVRPGQRVVINPQTKSGVIGNGGSEGAFTEHLLVRDADVGNVLLPIPEGVSYEIAALTEPLGVALHGVNRSEAKPGDKVVVFGCGPIGLGVVLWLVDRGVTEVVAVDLCAERLERAQQLGARATVQAGKEDLRARLAELHGREWVFNHEGVGTHIYIDAAGAPNILAEVAAMARKHARLIIIAAYMKPVEFRLGSILTNEMTITSSMGYPTELPDVVAALPRLKHKLESLISHRFPFDRALDAIGVAGTPGSAKVMVEFDGAAP